jgi:ABC-2 type transport system permease protein
MSVFSISPRRTYLIARRDFLGYIKTWGFWLTALGPFLGIIFGILFPLILSGSEPTRYATILDETGMHAGAIEELLVTNNDKELESILRGAARITIPQKDKEAFNKVLDEQGIDAARELILETSPIMAKLLDLPDTKLVFISPPANTVEELKPYLTGTEKLTIENEVQTLSGVLHIYETDGETKAEFWSTAPNKNELVSLANQYFADAASQKYMAAAGLSRKQALQERKNALRVSTFNPSKQIGDDGTQTVTAKDRIPYLVAAGLAMMLWFTVFTGAYMLLVSMVEEKINKVLEMLLATTRFSEIFLGKLLGVAALTLASLLPWIILGGIGFYGAMQFADGAIAEGLTKALSPQMIVFLPVFFILGYVFYGSMFIALGALAESMQDASTLMTPMVLLLTACIMVVPIGIAYPDSPLLAAAAWFPFSAPFAAVIRLPSDPPLWETLGSMMVLIVSSALVIWGSARMFRHGILSGGGMAAIKSWGKAWFSRIVLRKKNG